MSARTFNSFDNFHLFFGHSPLTLPSPPAGRGQGEGARLRLPPYRLRTAATFWWLGKVAQRCFDRFGSCGEVYPDSGGAEKIHESCRKSRTPTSSRHRKGSP